MQNERREGYLIAGFKVAMIRPRIEPPIYGVRGERPNNLATHPTETFDARDRNGILS